MWQTMITITTVTLSDSPCPEMVTELWHVRRHLERGTWSIWHDGLDAPYIAPDTGGKFEDEYETREQAVRALTDEIRNWDACEKC